MPLKICFISSMHFANDKRIHYKQCKTLVGKGHDVTHICRSDNNNHTIENSKADNPKRFKYLEEYFIDGVKVIHFKSRNRLIGRILSLKCLYKISLKQNADIYHCNEIDSWFIGILLKLFNKKRCFFDVHEHYISSFPQVHFPAFLHTSISFLIRLLYIILTPLTDKIILAKKSVSRDFYCKEEKKVLVRNFVPVSNIPKRIKTIPRSSDETFTVVHLGLFNKVRGGHRY